MSDRVNHPSHYTWLRELCGVEVIDITRHMDFDLGNAVKYILRQGHKSEEGMTDTDKAIEDLEKAVWYINDKIKTMKKNSENICIGYVNIMYDTESSTYVTSGPVYSSREAAYAEGVGKSNYITTVEVKWEAL